MDYAIRRLNSDAGSPPRYELMGSDGASLLLTDKAESSKSDAQQQVRLVRPDGRLEATMNLSEVAAAPEEEGGVDYAIVHDFAVYAIVGVRQRPAADKEGERGIYFILEVEGEKWLALPDPERMGCYSLYDEVPPGLHTYDTLTELDLPPSVGHICTNGNDHAFLVELSPQRLEHTGLLVLALALLIDRPDKTP